MTSFFSLYFIFITILKSILIIIFILISVAYFTLAERKILASTQRRRGPNVIGLYGLLQPLADGLKLLTKEPIYPSNSNKFLFLIAPLITFFISLLSWAVIPFDKYAFIAELDLSFLYMLAVSSLGVYGIIIAGWSSNSKYAFLGAMRSSAQMISYEISIGVVLYTFVISTGSYNINKIIFLQEDIGWFVFYFPLIFILFFICALAETNRHPFDLPEAEAELVSGYNVEYSAMTFALFSLGEYSNILVMSSINIILFFGGWSSLFFLDSIISGSILFGIKILFFVFLFVLFRTALPRYRYDQLMEIGWQIFLLISLAFFFFFFINLWLLNGLPY